MDGRFDLRETSEEAIGASLGRRGERRPIDHPADFAETPVCVVMVMPIIVMMMVTRAVIVIGPVVMSVGVVRPADWPSCVRPPDPSVTLKLVAPIPERWVGLASTRTPSMARLPSATRSFFDREAGIDQRADNHVAGGAGEAVEVENFGHTLLFRFRALP